MQLLEGEKLTKRFGGIVALRDLSFHVSEGEILGLIGPNGAGKTTLFNIISGTYHPDSGRIRFLKQDITDLKPYEICKRGISRTFQSVKPFFNQTVLQNAMVGALFCRPGKMSMQQAAAEAAKTLEVMDLNHKKDVLIRDLNAEERKRAEICRALAGKPKLLMLDEPMAGLSPEEEVALTKAISAIREMGATVFIIEHVLSAVMNLSDRVIVMHHGEKLAEGTPKEVVNHSEVLSVYLGEAYRTSFASG